MPDTDPELHHDRRQYDLFGVHGLSEYVKSGEHDRDVKGAIPFAIGLFVYVGVLSVAVWLVISSLSRP
jgi:hypothetical protein